MFHNIKKDRNIKGGLMMILLWILIGIGIYYLLIEKRGISFNQTQEKDAETVLKLRYVNGEIDDEKYERMKKLIKK